MREILLLINMTWVINGCDKVNLVINERDSIATHVRWVINGRDKIIIMYNLECCHEIKLCSFKSDKLNHLYKLWFN